MGVIRSFHISAAKLQDGWYKQHQCRASLELWLWDALECFCQVSQGVSPPRAPLRTALDTFWQNQHQLALHPCSWWRFPVGALWFLRQEFQHWLRQSDKCANFVSWPVPSKIELFEYLFNSRVYFVIWRLIVILNKSWFVLVPFPFEKFTSFLSS